MATLTGELHPRPPGAPRPAWWCGAVTVFVERDGGVHNILQQCRRGSFSSLSGLMINGLAGLTQVRQADGAKDK